MTSSAIFPLVQILGPCQPCRLKCVEVGSLGFLVLRSFGWTKGASNLDELKGIR